MVKVFEETVKGPIRRQRSGDVKTAVMGNKKVIVKVVNKIRNHRETFAFHDNESADHGVVGETFPSGFGKFGEKGKIQVEEKGIIKLSNRL